MKKIKLVATVIILAVTLLVAFQVVYSGGGGPVLTHQR